MEPKTSVLVLLLLAVLTTSAPASAAASADAISCYTSVPRAPGQRPAATPVAYPRRDGYSACLRYQYRCTADTATCLASEIGSWKHHYYGSSAQQCRSILSNAPNMGLRSVFCCTADRCNAPDPRRDPTTQLLPDSWLSRSRPMSSRSSPRSSAAAAPIAAAPSSQAGFAALNDSAAAAPVAVPLVAPAAPLVAAGRAAAPAVAQQRACWYSIPSAPGRVREAALLEVEPGAQFCARWQVRCTMPSTICSQADVAARTWRWVYGSVDDTGCDAMKPGGVAAGSKGVRNALCCSGVGCNKPDNKLDAATTIRTEAAAESAAKPQLQQQQQQQQRQQLTAIQPGAGAGVTVQQPIMIAALGSAGHLGSGGISRLGSKSSVSEGSKVKAANSIGSSSSRSSTTGGSVMGG
ncbi:hypothetical protein COO60DRAFT_316528 [Scenedesmus sp. NREL 46B-D3]|nr:hypothetical protein COO60DRAFT_316528 [Scenedesmus sp. NREL 46B-D3]